MIKEDEMVKKSVISFLFISVVIVCTTANAQHCENEYDVPFVPTKQKIVDIMLKTAKVNKNDILYDLGCGDGRIVITAAKKFGARGVGIDINPERISESRENAAKEGVEDKVQFIEQDLFEANIREATVVSLYLLPSVNLKLRPKLFRELKPGTRMVSHDFNMGEWEPDQSLNFDNDYDIQYDFDNHNVYFWILPANVSGTWEWTMSSGAEQNHHYLHLNQKFQKLKGNLTEGESKISLKNITIKGDSLHFVCEQYINGEKTIRTYTGFVNDDTITGNIVTQTNAVLKEAVWKARRDPSTIIPFKKSNAD